MSKSIITTIATTLLVLLWSYTALSKLADLGEFKRQINAQVFGQTTANILIYLIPISELIAMILLIFHKSRLMGLGLSAVLMLAFTSYIALVLGSYFPEHPCSCGGVLKNMDWKTHFYFNLLFLSIAISGTIVQYKTLKSGGALTQ